MGKGTQASWERQGKIGSEPLRVGTEVVFEPGRGVIGSVNRCLTKINQTVVSGIVKGTDGWPV